MRQVLQVEQRVELVEVLQAGSDEGEGQPGEVPELEIVVEQSRVVVGKLEMWQTFSLSPVPSPGILEPNFYNFKWVSYFPCNGIQLFSLGPRVHLIMTFENERLLLRYESSLANFPVLLTPSVPGPSVLAGDALVALIVLGIIPVFGVGADRLPEHLFGCCLVHSFNHRLDHLEVVRVPETVLDAVSNIELVFDGNFLFYILLFLLYCFHPWW